MIKVSVVVPFYNGNEQRLDRCISSIEESSTIEHEIILVNDGSSSIYDGFLDDICSHYKNVRMISQENKGVSDARNRGIHEAKGEYIAFVDADDEVLNGYIDEAYDLACRYDAEFLIGKLYRGNDIPDLSGGSGKIVKVHNREKVESHLLNYNALYHFKDGTYVGRGCVSRLIRRELALSNLFDTRLKVGEDMLWNIQVIESSKKTLFVNRLWYFYHENEESVSNATNPEIADCFEKTFSRLFETVDMKNPYIYREMVGYYFESMKTIHRLFLYSGLNGLKDVDKNRVINNIYERFEFQEIFGSDLYDSLGYLDKTQLLLFKGKRLFNEYDCFRRLRDIKRSFK